MNKVILFGAGKYGREALKIIGRERVAFFVDNNLAVNKNEVYGVKIIEFGELKQIYKKYDVVISVSEKNECSIMQQCIENGIYDFILYDEILDYYNGIISSSNLDEIRQKHFLQLSNDMKNKYIISERKRKFLEEHISVSDLQPARGYKRKLQLELVDFADILFQMLKEINVFPFLICGNLLGKLRHNGFVPWDDDLDFGVTRKEYESLKKYFSDKGKMFYYEGKDGDEFLTLHWVEELLGKNKNQYLLCIFPTNSQVIYGTNLMDIKRVDFFPFDYYDDKYDFDEHKKLIFNMYEEIKNCIYAKEQTAIIEKYRLMEEKYRNTAGKNIYFGLDSFLSYFRKNDNWIGYNTIFPLQHVEFEGHYFMAPNNIEEYIKYEYKDYRELPKDYGIDTHEYQIDYMKKNKITVEFYLVDSFEIFHYEPLYNILREHGIYAVFIAEDNETNTTGNWFDYKSAKKILEEQQLEYHEYCNENADFAFTTQDAYVLMKYKNAIKINMTYGDSCNKNGYWFAENAMKGFEYKFVQGMFQKEKCIEKNCMEESHIKVIGRPKSYFRGIVDIKDERKRIRDELGIHTDKKIIGYFPTWDDDSTIQLFYDTFLNLKDKYYIVTKPHHCTFRLPEKKRDMNNLYNISDLVLDGNYDFEKAALISDINICDAKSGAAIESVLIARDINTIFVSPKKYLNEYFYREIYDIADAVINNPDELAYWCDRLVDECRKKKDKNTNRFFDREFGANDFWNMFKDLLPE